MVRFAPWTATSTKQRSSCRRSATSSSAASEKNCPPFSETQFLPAQIPLQRREPQPPSQALPMDSHCTRSNLATSRGVGFSKAPVILSDYVFSFCAHARPRGKIHAPLMTLVDLIHFIACGPLAGRHLLSQDKTGTRGTK